jgi:exodeoxyribonuclease-3
MNSFWCDRIPATSRHAYDCGRPRAKHAHPHTQLQRCPLGGGKGLFDWLSEQDADVVCLQETKAQEHQLGDPCFRPLGYNCGYFDAKRPGYSGVAVFSKRKPDKIIAGFGVKEFDNEGRYLEFQFGKLSVVSAVPAVGIRRARTAGVEVPLPQGLPAVPEEARPARPKLRPLRRHQHRPQEIDLRNWKSNQKNSGFLPEERAWLDRVFGELKWVDAFREVDARPTSTPGGRTAARRARRTSAGASTTRSRARASRAAQGPPRSSATGGSPITRRSRWITSCDRGQAATQLEGSRPRLPAAAGAVDAVPRLLGGPSFLSGVPDAVGLAPPGRHRARDDRDARLGRARLHPEVHLVPDRGPPPDPAALRMARQAAQLDAACAGRDRRWPPQPRRQLAGDGHHARRVGALFLAFCSATQDISVDAWRIESASLDQQGAMVAAYQLGYRAALITGSAGALGLAQGYGWATSYTVMAALAGIGILTTLLVREPATSVRKTAADGEARVADWLAARPNWPEPDPQARRHVHRRGRLPVHRLLRALRAAHGDRRAAAHQHLPPD